MDIRGDRENAWAADAQQVHLHGLVAPDRRGTVASIREAGFARGTRFATKAGACAVEDLRPGMRLLTSDRGYRELLWVGPWLAWDENGRAPVRIAPGALGNEGALTLAPRHRLVLQADRGRRLGRDIRIAAEEFLDRPGVSLATGSCGALWHLRFRHAEIVFAEGLRVETLRPEWQALCPELSEMPISVDPRSLGHRAAPVLQSRLSRRGGVARFLAGSPVAPAPAPAPAADPETQSPSRRRERLPIRLAKCCFME